VAMQNLDGLVEPPRLQKPGSLWLQIGDRVLSIAFSEAAYCEPRNNLALPQKLVEIAIFNENMEGLDAELLHEAIGLDNGDSVAGYVGPGELGEVIAFLVDRAKKNA